MEREAFKEKAMKEIDHFFNKIDELESKKVHANEEVKAKFNKKKADLKARKLELQAKLDEIADATDERWDEVKEAFSAGGKHFKEAFEDISSLFKKHDDQQQKKNTDESIPLNN